MKKTLLATVLVTAFVGSSSALAYTVQPGDTLWKVANANNATVKSLMEANNLSSTEIYPGQNLVVPGQVQPSIHTYTVITGDSLWKIATKHKVTVQALMQANNLKNNDIYPGQKLIIPKTMANQTVSSDSSQPDVREPAMFKDGVFPLAKDTYQPYTDTYGDSRNWTPNGNGTRPHQGVDIVAKKGTPIYSAAEGTIINQGWNEFGGWRLTVRVNNSTAFYYAHMSGYANGIVKGGQVKKGQLIGYVGSTGYGPVGTEGKFVNHLHFGIYKTNTPSWTAIDPYPYLKWWESKR